jgi:sorbitol/mannitol transport system substrate-binding protein
MKDAGPQGASSNGFNENLALFQQGKCGMWIDATVAASFVTNPKDSTVADKVGFALAPDTGLGKRGNWLWAWNLAIPAGTQKAEAAEKFVAWATSKHYLDIVAAKEGWANVPPGTRTSLYNNAEYLKAAPFAKMTLDSINAADPKNPSVKPVPYVGVQFVAIPEFQGLGTTVGQLFSAALAGQMTVDDALAQAQQVTTREMTKAVTSSKVPSQGKAARTTIRVANSNLASPVVKSIVTASDVRLFKKRIPRRPVCCPPGGAGVPTGIRGRVLKWQRRIRGRLRAG